jgi:hypothetical protein
LHPLEKRRLVTAHVEIRHSVRDQVRAEVGLASGRVPSYPQP